MLQHKHLIVRAEVLNPPKTTQETEAWLINIIHDLGMQLAVGLQSNPISYRCNLEGNEGITGVAVLETSHCAVHIWDAESPALLQWDLYSCSEVKPEEMLKHLEQFNPVKVEYRFLDRENNLTVLK
jgi:S-adenosylmethionine/arginine decarboxylase-like enzyme